MNARLVLFDLDGTLVDSLRDLAESANQLIVECGGTPHPQEKIAGMIGDGAATLVARALSSAGVAWPADALKRFLAIYNVRVVRHTRPYAGVPEMLDALLPRVPLAVLTNKPLGATREILDALGLARYFDADLVVGGDGPFPRKPDPAGLLHLVKEAGVTPAEAVLVGDSINDWRAARAGGARACMARYGFGFTDFPAGQLGHDDLVIDRPADLLSRILGSGEIW